MEGRLLLSAVADHGSSAVADHDGGFIELRASGFGYIAVRPGAATEGVVLGSMGEDAFASNGPPEPTSANVPLHAVHDAHADTSHAGTGGRSAPACEGCVDDEGDPTSPSRPSPAKHAADSPGAAPSGSPLPPAHASDAELIRLVPGGLSSSAPGEGLIDLTEVLTKPIGSHRPQPIPWADDPAGLAGRSDPASSAAESAEGPPIGDPRFPWRRVAMADSPGERAAAGAHHLVANSGWQAGLAGRLGSPYDQIEGSRGISQAFELAPLPDPGSARDGPEKDAEAGLPSATTPDRSDSPPHRPSRPQASEHSAQNEPWTRCREQTSNQAAEAVTAQSSDPPERHDAALEEWTDDLGDALLGAVYLDDKRPIDVIPLLTAAALSEYLATNRRQAHEDERALIALRRPNRPTPCPPA
jgi:hypothetical protein